jgi:disulfide bond formation protein DsbB
MLQMSKIFVGLVFWNIVLFAITIWLGLTHHSSHWQHQAMGVLTGIYTCLTHSIVLMHFMGSGKAIKEAVETHGLADDPQTGYVRRTRRFKGQASGHATLCCVAIIVTVCLGGWMDTHKGNVTAHRWHMWFALATVVYNLYAFRVEYKVIAENTAMIREIDARIQSRRSSGISRAPPLHRLLQPCGRAQSTDRSPSCPLRTATTFRK